MTDEANETKPEFPVGFFEFNISPATDEGYVIYEAPNTANPVAALTTPREVGDWITHRLRVYAGEPNTVDTKDDAIQPRVIRMWNRK